MNEGSAPFHTSFHARMVFSGGTGVKQIRVHDLRHSFGSIWAQRLPLTVLKEMMGHASIKTTERYIHTTAEVFRLTITEALSNIDKKTRKND
jgi:integrase